MYQITLDKFSGPLDLLLQLIESQELDISQVALATVTDQYLSYLEKAEDIGATDLADFLVVATKLLIIKSKALLPQMDDEEEDSAEQLEAQLKMYKEYLDASRKIEALLNEKKFCFTRERLPINFQPAFSPPEKLVNQDLADVFQEILNRIDYVVNLPQKIMEKVASLKESMINLRSLVDKCEKFTFRNVLTEAKNKSEVVVCFMALLELIKSGEVAVTQQGVWDDIYVEKA